MAIGFTSGVSCWFAATQLKIRLGYDDSLDVFGVHGVGGIIGTVLVGVFAAGACGGTQGELAIGKQVGIQLLALVVTIVYTLLATYLVLKVVDVVVGLRVDENSESQGLDIALHEEAGYNL